MERAMKNLFSSTSGWQEQSSSLLFALLHPPLFPGLPAQEAAAPSEPSWGAPAARGGRAELGHTGNTAWTLHYWEHQQLSCPPPHPLLKRGNLTPPEPSEGTRVRALLTPPKALSQSVTPG